MSEHAVQFRRLWRCGLFAAIGLALLFWGTPWLPGLEPARHSGIVQALLSGQNWGRQALVGNLEFPLLPTVLLLCCEQIGQLVQLSGERLFLALLLLVCLWQLTALLRLCRHGWFFLLLLAAALTHPHLRAWAAGGGLSDGTGVLALSLLLFTVRRLELWHRQPHLRHLFLAALAMGLLGLCGLEAILCTGLALPGVYWGMRLRLNSLRQPVAGLGTALVFPYVYVLALYLLWNWLVMDDPLYFWRNLWLRALAMDRQVLREALTPAALIHLWILLLLVKVLLARRGGGSPAMFLLPAAVALPLGHALFSAMYVECSAFACLTFGLAVGALFLLAEYGGLQKPWRQGAAVAVLLLLLHWVPADRASGCPRSPEPPAVDELLALVDLGWPDARIMLYGLRLALAYPDAREQRFVARLDFQEEALLKQAGREQLFLLLPPPTGYYAPLDNPRLQALYAHGAPWLLLEKQWPGGWQLARLVLPPAGESRLDDLR